MPEQVTTGNMSPAMSGLQNLTLSAPPTAWPAHHPDHRGQGLLHLRISDLKLKTDFLGKDQNSKEI